MTGSQSRESFTSGQTSDSPSNTRGKSRMHQRARTDPSGGRGATRVPTGTQGNADLVFRRAFQIDRDPVERAAEAVEQIVDLGGSDDQRRAKRDGVAHVSADHALTLHFGADQTAKSADRLQSRLGRLIDDEFDGRNQSNTTDFADQRMVLQLIQSGPESLARGRSVLNEIAFLDQSNRFQGNGRCHGGSP